MGLREEGQVSDNLHIIHIFEHLPMILAIASLRFANPTLSAFLKSRYILSSVVEERRPNGYRIRILLISAIAIEEPLRQMQDVILRFKTFLAIFDLNVLTHVQ